MIDKERNPTLEGTDMNNDPEKETFEVVYGNNDEIMFISWLLFSKGALHSVKRGLQVDLLFMRQIELTEDLQAFQMIHDINPGVERDYFQESIREKELLPVVLTFQDIEEKPLRHFVALREATEIYNYLENINDLWKRNDDGWVVMEEWPFSKPASNLWIMQVSDEIRKLCFQATLNEFLPTYDAIAYAQCQYQAWEHIRIQKSKLARKKKMETRDFYLKQSYVKFSKENPLWKTSIKTREKARLILSRERKFYEEKKISLRMIEDWIKRYEKENPHK